VTVRFGAAQFDENASPPSEQAACGDAGNPLSLRDKFIFRL
jgi:hypothetical protein